MYHTSFGEFVYYISLLSLFIYISYLHFYLQGGAADRTLSIGHGSDGINELIAKSMEEFRFDLDWNYKKNVDERDVHDLPNYFAKDDGLLLWKAIKAYVKDVVNIFYFRDTDVQQDEELVNWINEINE